MDYDRGRVTLAASITPSAAWGGRSFAMTGNEVSLADLENPTKLKLHNDLLTSIMIGLERLLVNRASVPVAAEDWAEAEQKIETAARARRKRNTVVLIAVFTFLGLFVGLIVFSLSR